MEIKSFFDGINALIVGVKELFISCFGWVDPALAIVIGVGIATAIVFRIAGR